MKTLLIMCVFSVLTMTACQLSSAKVYKLSDERMAHLMLDLQLAEVALLDINPRQQDSIKMIIDKRIEEFYHLTNAEVKNEMELLQSDPKKLKWVVDRAKQVADSIQ